MPVQVVDSNGKSSVPSNSFSLNPQMAGNLLPQGHYPLRRPGSRLGLAVSTDTGRTSRTGRTGKQMRVNTNGDGPNLSRTPPKFSNTSNSSILELFTIHKKMKDTPEFIKAINAGLESDNNALKMIESGEGGVYLIHNEDGQMIAIFKPQDEDPFSPNNPKLRGLTSSSSPNAKTGILPGEAALNEVAAYLLDYDGFANVPYTVFAECDHSSSGFHSKVGSLQRYITHSYESWDLGSQFYSTSEVHRIGILDIRIMNVDRHGGNILVQNREFGDCADSKYKLVPIDHGYSFPDSFESKELWFEWYIWPQAKEPFDEACLAYISKLDPFGDAHLLRTNLRLRDECIRTMIIATSILKEAAKRHMTLAQIAELFLSVGTRKKKSFAEVISSRFDPKERFSTSNSREYLRTSIIGALDVKFHHQTNKDRCSGKSNRTTNQQVRFTSPDEDQYSTGQVPFDLALKRQKSVPALLDQLQFQPEISNDLTQSYTEPTSTSFGCRRVQSSATEYDLSTMSPPSFFPSFLNSYQSRNGASSPLAASPASPCSFSRSPIKSMSIMASPTPILKEEIFLPSNS
eukprot:TRINITY_DN1166_c0_g1_i3.p1 TRINITY_DN1166_c0_g1~~TRINITY_DN1166_c0_g1_i3.p1  ORF type:complete len:573 (-),score=159.78 TRINITY_DN1166_c0_g1_i3:179-1897(-)